MSKKFDAKMPIQLVPTELDDAYTPVEAIGKIVLKLNEIIQTQNILTEYIQGITEPIAREIIERIAQEVIEEQIGAIVADINQLKQDVLSHTNQISSLSNNKQNKIDNGLQTNIKTIVGAINEVNTKADNFSSGKQDKNDNALETIAKTIVGAINELNANKQSKDDANLSTTSKQVVSAINEILSNVNLKQNKTANELSTTSKNIVNAINEIFEAVQANTVSIDGLITSVLNKQDKNDNTLLTTAKTIVGAINELVGKAVNWGNIGGNILNQIDLSNELSLKQNSTDNALSTNLKTIVGGINENKSNIELKQDIQDTTLITQHKDIVGAINEIAEGILGESKWGNISGVITNQIDLMNQFELRQLLTDNALATTDKTTTGAINELKEQIDNVETDVASKQDANDNLLLTGNKNIVQAINELLSKLDTFEIYVSNNKQNKQVDTLLTTSKFIDGAINENTTNITQNASDIEDIKETIEDIPLHTVVEELPTTPDENTFYYIEE